MAGLCSDCAGHIAVDGPLEVLNCENCGACCTNMGHPRFYRTAVGAAADPHYAALPAALRQELDDYIDGLTDIDLGQPCIWYDAGTRGCRHYEHRPQMCRDFEVGSFHCLRMRRAQGIDPPLA